MDIDLVGEFRGSRRRAKIIETPYGPIRVACVEDMLVKRLNELKYWPTSAEWRRRIVQQVTVLLASSGSEIDEEYLAFLVRRDDLDDLLSEFRSRLPSRDAPRDQV